MAGVGSRYRERSVNYWPGFVDALATLLLAIMFLLSVFVLAQFLLSQEITGKDAVLNRLNSQIDELTSLLALEKSTKQNLEDSLANIEASLVDAESERSRLQTLLDAESGTSDDDQTQIGNLSSKLDEERQLSQRALSQVELLNQQIAALRRQIGALEDALDASESRDRESQTKIADLGKRSKCCACAAGSGTQSLSFRLSLAGYAKFLAADPMCALLVTGLFFLRKFCFRPVARS